VGTAKIEDIDTAKVILLVGTNPRLEAPVLNARLRKAWANGAMIGLIGEQVDLSYDYKHMGSDRAALVDLVGRVTQKDNTLVIIGQGAINEADGEAVLSQAMAYVQGSGAKFLVLHTAAGRVGAMDVGAVTEGGLAMATQGAQVIYNLGADEVEISRDGADAPFVIYQGSHGDRGANRADIILPGAAYTEENGLFVNTEGRPQLAFRAGFAPGEAKENWAILRALSAEVGQQLPWDSLAGLRAALVKAHPHLGRVDEVPENAWAPLEVKLPAKATFRNAIKDFYLTNPIARASSVMAELSAMAKARAAAPIAAE
jgi:NADH-quinone oxidoreductase subunit G